MEIEAPHALRSQIALRDWISSFVRVLYKVAVKVVSWWRKDLVIVSTPKVAWNNGLPIVTYLKSWRSECLELVFSTCYSDQLAVSTLLMIQVSFPSPLRRSTTVPCCNAPSFPVFHMIWSWWQRTVFFVVRMFCLMFQLAQPWITQV